jgi:transcriptional regulator with XRE-family HTH domain
VVNHEVAELSGALRALRERSGRTLRELERLTHVSDSSLSRYFLGRTVPPWSVVEVLCRAAERNPGELRPAWEAARRSARFPAPAPALAAAPVVPARPAKWREARSWSLVAVALVAAAALTRSGAVRG